MNKAWLELESDPGVFTLLLEDFGAQGLQVEEVYDLQKPIEGPVYGFIFLFKWNTERRYRRKLHNEVDNFVKDNEIVNKMFFAQQVIPNSCASHALISVLLNCQQIVIGDTLQRLKNFSCKMSPENKGYAICNMPDLAQAHNSHARPEPRKLPDKATGIGATKTRETFHFVSYVPIDGTLYELDGLKPHPIDHGPCGKGNEWVERFRGVIKDRIGGCDPDDIRFSLMAVVPEKRQIYQQRLKTLQTNREKIVKALQQLVDSKAINLMSECNKLAHGKPELIIKTRSAARRVARQTELKQQQQSDTASSNSTDSNTQDGEPSPILPLALDNHNYCKSPMAEDQENADSKSDNSKSTDVVESDSLTDVGVEDASVHSADEDANSSLVMVSGEKMQLDKIQDDQVTPVKGGAVKIEICMTDGDPEISTLATSLDSTDITKLLIINTTVEQLTGPGSDSTDTASELGSIFSSPNSSATMSCQSSPSLPSSLKTSPATSALPHPTPNTTQPTLTTAAEGQTKKPAVAAAAAATGGASSTAPIKQEPAGSTATESDAAAGAEVKTEDVKDLTGDLPKLQPQQGFLPKDLLLLCRNIEKEILATELSLREEFEKRKKYKIDDSRRTHCYDQFICTFLSMLAEQGHLADLVKQQHNITSSRSVPKKRPAPSSASKRAAVDKKKRAKAKKKK